MAPFQRKRKNSDPSYYESSRSKRSRALPVDDQPNPTSFEPDLFEATASLPSSPTQPPTDGIDEEPSFLDLDKSPAPFIHSLFPRPATPTSPIQSSSHPPSHPVSPAPKSSPIHSSPVKPRGPGRPPKSPRKLVRTRSIWYMDRERKSAESMRLSAVKKMRSKEMKRATLEASRKAEKDAELVTRKSHAYEYIEALTKPSSEGGFDFKSMSEFFETLSSLEGPSNQQIESKLTKFARKHGKALTYSIWRRAPEIKEEILTDELCKKLASKGRALQELLTHDNCKSMGDLFQTFTLVGLIAEIKQATPFLWEALLDVVDNPERRAEGKIRNKELMTLSH
ncbi:hypothetical protein EV361DRAFT_956994 [Lentinula raphanica]|nr:hypothetical protein EV361DRAFT_956994 [Lentinula raphanica]